MLFIFSTPVLIRHLWQLKTVFFSCIGAEYVLFHSLGLFIGHKIGHKSINNFTKATTHFIINKSNYNCKKFNYSLPDWLVKSPEEGASGLGSVWQGLA